MAGDRGLLAMAFPPVRLLSAYPKQVRLQDIDLITGTTSSGLSELAPPDTAVVAELETVLSSSGSSLLCSLKGGVHLRIYNAIPESWPREKSKLAARYPRALIAIKSGLIKRTTATSATSGTSKPKPAPVYTISVSCPAAVEFLKLAQKDQLLPTPSISKEDLSVVYRALGDDKLSKEEYVHALLYFAAAGEEAGVSSQPEDNLLRAYNGSIGCCMELKRFEEVIRLSSKVLSINPRNVKSLYLRAVALSELQCHAEAVECLNAAFTISPKLKEKASFRESLSVATRRAEQQKSGEYEIANYFVNGFRAEDTPDCSDYVSKSLEIKMTGDGRGRGLFLSRDVKVGELLMVGNRLWAESSTEALALQAIQACGYSRLTRRMLEFLPDTESMEDLPLPKIQDFLYNPSSSSGEDDGGVIDVERIRKVVELASLHSFKVMRNPETGEVRRKQVFGLPTLVNHSCMPNSSLVAVGDAVFIRAATPLKAGEEITVGYINCLQQIRYRSQMLMSAGWRFGCKCRRCDVERRYEDAFRGMPDIVLDEKVMLGDLMSMLGKFEEALRKLKAVPVEERALIQVGYGVAYLIVADSGKPELRMEGKLQTLSQIQERLPGNWSSILLVVREILRYVRELVWVEFFEELLGNAMAALMGNVELPSGDYLAICYNIDTNKGFEVFGF